MPRNHIDPDLMRAATATVRHGDLLDWLRLNFAEVSGAEVEVVRQAACEALTRFVTDEELGAAFNTIWREGMVKELQAEAAMTRKPSTARQQRARKPTGLVLSRRERESIVVYDAQSGAVLATLRVCSVKGGKVRLGVSADQSIGIDREEIYAKRATQRGSLTA